MLIRDEGETWTAIGQQAHAWLAGQLARAWEPALPASVLLGIEQHDVAWSALDRRPPLHAEAGRAAAFFELPRELRLPMWERVVDRLAHADPYAAVLVSLHAVNVHTRYAREQPAAFVEAQRADQDALLARMAHVTRAQVEAHAELCFRIDALSLEVCASAEPVIDLDEWPFAGEQLRVGVHERTFTERFADEAALHAALDRAPFAWREWTLRPSRVARAIEIAREAHEGQLDKAGQPYLQHPLHVMRSVAHRGESAKIVAVLHDYFEDCAEHAETCDLSFLTPDERDALERLTHRDGDDYLGAYLDRILQSPLATLVKEADLRHNLDLSRRIDAPFTARDLERCNRYRIALARVRESLASGAALAE